MGGSWIHLKFESDSITECDLRRFREYEAYIGMIYKVPAATSVLCTSKSANASAAAWIYWRVRDWI